MINVSIHAPVKGATTFFGESWSSYRGFNSRSREGSDLSSFFGTLFLQSFNSRSREGSDRAMDDLQAGAIKFQFTLP